MIEITLVLIAKFVDVYLEVIDMRPALKVGSTFKIYLAGSPRPLYKCHVLAIVDEDMIVYKWYGKHKQWWHYNVESLGVIQNRISLTEFVDKKLKPNTLNTGN